MRELHCVQLKINANAGDALNKLAGKRNIRHPELIEHMLLANWQSLLATQMPQRSE